MNIFKSLVHDLKFATTAPKRTALAGVYGIVCHLTFAGGVGSMIYVMATGMQAGQGSLNGAIAWIANLLLILQFPLAHSLLLSKRGRPLLAKLAPKGHGTTLAATTYAIIASIQLLILFWAWSPSGSIWWTTPQPYFYGHLAIYMACFALLAKSTSDAGIGLQSGALGWVSLWRGQKPRYPDLPVTGLFRLTRQPIYVAFTMTLWTTPVWSPDQLLLATIFTIYCVAAPKLKERRFDAMFGERFRQYQKRVPYWLPFPRPGTSKEIF